MDWGTIWILILSSRSTWYKFIRPGLRLGLGQWKSEKKGLPSQSGRSRTGKYWDGAWAGAHTNHRQPMYGQGRRAMSAPRGPQTQLHEGTCAIKVSMKCLDGRSQFIKDWECARTMFIQNNVQTNNNEPHHTLLDPEAWALSAERFSTYRPKFVFTSSTRVSTTTLTSLRINFPGKQS